MALFAFEGVAVHGDDDVPTSAATTRHAILDVITLEVGTAGTTCILGPSGAGKSTLLRLCNRLDVPSAGTVRFRGDDVADLDPLDLRRRVGMVFQRPTLFGGTVADNLRVAVPDAATDVLVAALGRARLGPAFLDRRADTLSGGEAQRVCVARTLVTEPEVLLMDEPTAALDPAARFGLEELAGDLAAGGVPILWVTHDLDQAQRVGGDVVVLIRGRVRCVGSMADVRACDDPEVVAFLRDETAADEG